MERTREVEFPPSARRFMTQRATFGLALLLLSPLSHSILGSEPPSSTEIAVPGEETLQDPVLTEADEMALPLLDITETQAVEEQSYSDPLPHTESAFDLFALLQEIEHMFWLLGEEWSLDHAIADDGDVSIEELMGIFIGIGVSIEPSFSQFPVIFPE